MKFKIFILSILFSINLFNCYQYEDVEIRKTPKPTEVIKDTYTKPIEIKEKADKDGILNKELYNRKPTILKVNNSDVEKTEFYNNDFNTKDMVQVQIIPSSNSNKESEDVSLFT